MRCLFVAVGLNARFIMLPTPGRPVKALCSNDIIIRSFSRALVEYIDMYNIPPLPSSLNVPGLKRGHIQHRNGIHAAIDSRPT